MLIWPNLTLTEAQQEAMSRVEPLVTMSSSATDEERMFGAALIALSEFLYRRDCRIIIYSSCPTRLDAIWSKVTNLLSLTKAQLNVFEYEIRKVGKHDDYLKGISTQDSEEMQGHFSWYTLCVVDRDTPEDIYCSIQG